MLVIVLAAQMFGSCGAQLLETNSRIEALRRTKVTMARFHVQQSLAVFQGGLGAGELVYLWSKRLMRAEQALPGSRGTAKETPAYAHLKRCSVVELRSKQRIASDKGAGQYDYFFSD
jgi:hypothetical protein